MHQPKEKEADRLSAGPAISLGMELAVGMAIFAFGGYWLDRRRGTGEFWTLCGVGLGLLYVAYEVWKFARRLNAPPETREKRP